MAIPARGAVDDLLVPAYGPQGWSSLQPTKPCCAWVAELKLWDCILNVTWRVSGTLVTDTRSVVGISYSSAYPNLKPVAIRVCGPRAILFLSFPRRRK